MPFFKALDIVEIDQVKETFTATFKMEFDYVDPTLITTWQIIKYLETEGPTTSVVTVEAHILGYELETLKSRRLSSVSVDLWLSFTVQLCLFLCFCLHFGITEVVRTFDAVFTKAKSAKRHGTWRKTTRDTTKRKSLFAKLKCKWSMANIFQCPKRTC